MTIIGELSSQELGERIRVARENAHLTQANAAKQIGIARTTLVAIEKGDRRARISELQVLANMCGLSLNALLRREAVHIDLMPRFRKLVDVETQSVEDAVHTLNNLVSADIELENILGIRRTFNYPPEKIIGRGDVIAQAKEHASFLRQFLGIGQGPVTDIFSLIEIGIGIRLYQRRLNSNISGLFSFDEKIGAAILLNANHPLERRVQSAAHELGHFVGTRRSPEVLEENERFQSREERYAHAFGRIFLAPDEVVSPKFREITAGSTHLTRRHVIQLSDYVGISRMAMVLRLEELSLVRKGTWSWFEENGGITNRQVEEALNPSYRRRDPGRDDAGLLVPSRTANMAYEVWKKDLMTEGQLSSLLKITRINLRKLLDDIETGDNGYDSVLQLPQ